MASPKPGASDNAGLLKLLRARFDSGLEVIPNDAVVQARGLMIQNTNATTRTHSCARLTCTYKLDAHAAVRDSVRGD